MHPVSPDEDPRVRKRALRETLRAQRQEIDARSLREMAIGLYKSLAALEALIDSDVLLGSVPVLGEVDPVPFQEAWISTGRILVLPRALPRVRALELYRVEDLNNLSPGFRGIPEPLPRAEASVPPAAIESVLMPGLAYDRTGRRLGQGGGYYDRLVPMLRADVLLIGIAYDFQVIDEVPTLPHDARVHYIATPTQLIDCRQKA